MADTATDSKLIQHYECLYGTFGQWTRGDVIPASWLLGLGHDIPKLMQNGVLIETDKPCNKPELLAVGKPKTAIDPAPALEAELTRVRAELDATVASNKQIAAELEAIRQGRDAMNRANAALTVECDRLRQLLAAAELKADRLTAEMESLTAPATESPKSKPKAAVSAA